MQETANIIVRVEHARRSTNDIKRLRNQLDAAEVQTGSFQRRVKSLGVTLAAGLSFVGIQAGVNSIREAKDEIGGLAGRVALATKETGDFNKVYKDLYQNAQRSGSAFRSSVTIFQRLSNSRKDLDVTNDQITQLTDTVTKLGVIGGSTNEELKNGLTQFSQAMSAGIVRAEEFNSIVENTPAIADSIAEALGKTKGELRELVVDGKLLSKDVFNALLSKAEQVNQQFAEMGRRSSQADQSFSNAFTSLIARADEGIGVTEKYIDVLDGLTSKFDAMTEQDISNYFENITDAATILAGIYVARLTPSILASVAAKRAAIAETIRYQTALASMAGVSGRAALGITAVGTAARGASAGMALLGGPLGVGLLAATALYTFAKSSNAAKNNVEQLSPKIKELTSNFNDFTEAGISSSIAAARLELERLNKVSQEAIDNVKGGGRSGRAKIKSIENRYKDEIDVVNKFISDQQEQLKQIQSINSEINKPITPVSGVSGSPKAGKVVNLDAARAQIQSLKDGMLEGEQAIKVSHLRRTEQFKKQYANQLELQNQHREASKAVMDAEIIDLQKIRDEQLKDSVKNLKSQRKEATTAFIAETKQLKISALERVGMFAEAEKARFEQQKTASQARRDELIASAEGDAQSIRSIKENFNALELANQKQHEARLTAIAKSEQSQRINALGGFFGQYAQLLGKQTTAGKRAAQAETVINTYSAAVKAYNSLAGIPIIGPALGAAAAGAAIGFGLQQVKQIENQSVGNFENGGIIGGSSFSGDRLTANVNSGEMILNRSQQKELFNVANGRGNGNSQPPHIVIENHGTPQEYQQKSITSDEVRYIARDVVSREAGDAVAKDFNNPNSKFSKSASRNMGSSRNRA